MLPFKNFSVPENLFGTDCQTKEKSNDKTHKNIDMYIFILPENVDIRIGIRNISDNEGKHEPEDRSLKKGEQDILTVRDFTLKIPGKIYLELFKEAWSLKIFMRRLFYFRHFYKWMF